MMPQSIRWSIVITLSVILLTQAMFTPISLVLLLLGMLGVFHHFLKHKKALPKWLIFMLLCVALGLIYLQYGTFLGVQAGVAILLSFLFAKALETKTARDLVVLFNFALFVSASSFLYSQSLWVSLAVIGCLISCFIGLYRLQHSAFDAVGGTASNRQDFKQVLAFIAYALPFFVLLFLFFPRFPPLWHIPIAHDQATTGLSDQMAPGDIAQLSQSSALAFRVVTDLKQLPPRNQLYWRAMVLDDYQAQRWHSAAENKYTLPFQADAEVKGLDYQYIAADPQLEWIMGLEKSVPVSQGLAMQPDWGIRYHHGRRAKAKPLTLRWIETGEWQRSDLQQQQERQRSLTYDKQFDPQAQQFAQQLYQNSGQDPKRYVAQLLDWYQQQGFQYSLSPGKLNQHHIDEFLFSRKVGFCEHYASSFTLLMRYVGIPARVVTGYQGGQAALDGNSWEVRQLDAHAWSEVWIDGKWQRIDPTAIIAPERIDLGMQDLIGQDQRIWGQGSALAYQQFTWVKQLRIWGDYAAFQWQHKVVGYDQGRQQQWLSRFGLNSSLHIGLLLMGSLALGLLLYVAILSLRQRQRLPQYERLLQQFNAQLPNTLQRHDSETHAAWLIRLSEQLEGQAKTDLRTLSEQDQRYRYAAQIPKFDPNLKRKLKNCANKLKYATKSLS